MRLILLFSGCVALWNVTPCHVVYAQDVQQGPPPSNQPTPPPPEPEPLECWLCDSEPCTGTNSHVGETRACNNTDQLCWILKVETYEGNRIEIIKGCELNTHNITVNTCTVPLYTVYQAVTLCFCDNTKIESGEEACNQNQIGNIGLEDTEVRKGRARESVSSRLQSPGLTVIVAVTVSFFAFLVIIIS